MKKRFANYLTGLTGVVIVLLIIISVNIILGGIRLRVDLTEDKIYTLSEGTRNLLGELERDVTLKFYATRGGRDLPVPAKKYIEQIEDLLREYESNSNGRVILERYDPRPDSEEEEWAQRYGLTGRPSGRLGLQQNLYIGLVAVSGKKESTIPFIDPSMESRLEYAVTRMIHEVTIDEKPALGILSSLDVMGGPPNPFSRAPQNQGWVTVSELRKQYRVTALDPTDQEIPENLQTLVLLHPKELPESMLFAIDQFILRGGRVLAFVDPLSLVDRQAAGEQAVMRGVNTASDLNRFSEAWGIELIDRSVVADLSAASNISFGTGAAERMPTWLSLRAEHIDRDDIVTASLESMMLPFAGAFRGTPAEGLTMTTLLHTSDEPRLVNSFMALQAGSEKMRNARREGRLPLAIRLQGTFKTAFPDGRPAPEGDAEQDTPDTAPMAGLSESLRPGTVVLVADVDMLHDNFALRNLNILGLYEPANDNLSFFLNMVEQLTGSEALIGLRSRGTFHRPFDRVIALEQEAQKKYQEEELKLTQKLQDTQRRINELQQAKSKDQQFILSPQQVKEIENFRKERFETQRQLKEVRKNFRRDIERLGMKIKVINLTLVPALVALAGLAYGIRRRSKASRR